MQIIAFFGLAVLFCVIAWIVLAFAMFLLRRQRVDPTGPGAAIIHIVLSLIVGIWLAYQVVLT